MERILLGVGFWVAALALFVAGFAGIIFTILRSQEGVMSLKEWARDNKYTIRSSDEKLMYWAWERRPQFRVEIEDEDGRVYRGIYIPPGMITWGDAGRGRFVKVKEIA